MQKIQTIVLYRWWKNPATLKVYVIPDEKTLLFNKNSYPTYNTGLTCYLSLAYYITLITMEKNICKESKTLFPSRDIDDETIQKTPKNKKILQSDWTRAQFGL